MTLIDQIATCSSRAVKVTGPARSGKTEVIVKRCMALIEQGIEPAQICVLTSCGFAVQALRERLVDTAGQLRDKARDIRVMTALDACIAMLDTPEARNATGRTPRLLAKHEYAFLLEDIKTSGISKRRLKNMLNFIYHQWADNKPTESWRTGEEAAICEQLERSLTLTGGMLVQEAPMLACAYLATRDSSEPKFASHVLVDEFQNLSCAEQTAACLMAGTQLVICGNVGQTVARLSVYPNPEGLEKFDALRRNVEVFELTAVFGSPQIERFAAAAGLQEQPQCASDEDAEDKGTQALKLIKFNTPDDELNGITKYLRLIVNSQDEPAAGRETCVLVPSKRWAKLAQSALAARGFETCIDAVSTNLGGDPRNLSRARAQVTHTRLNLLADPSDMVAWRAWCGFGNYLTNSDAWAGLEAYAVSNGLTLAEALDRAASEPKEPFLRSNVLVERWQSGHEFIKNNSKRCGFALMHAIGADEVAEFDSVIEELVGDETAAQICASMRRHILDPVFPQNPDMVRICTPQNLCGQSYKHMLVLGMIDGFFPKRAAFEVVSTPEDRAEALLQERRAFCDAVSKATETLTLSYFSKATLELAEKSKMQVARISASGGERVAWLRPSVFLQDAGASAPAALGGQAFMVEQESKLTADEDEK